jgi:NADH-quinone oxidoreductase subunit G
VVGQDDTFPKDRRRRPIDPVKFTIRAEKCPNRRGVEEILKHFQGMVITFADVVKDVDKGNVQALFVTAAYPPDVPAFDPNPISVLAKAPTLIVQDLFPTALSNAAKYVIPATTFAEKDGVFVNHADLAQAIHRAVRPPQEARTEGQVYLDLLGRTGLVQAAAIRKELAREVPYFAPLASELGSLGTRLSFGISG